MRVLIVSVGKMSGGIERYTLTLGTMLAKKGVMVYYAVRKGGWLESKLQGEDIICVEMGMHLVRDAFRVKKFAKKNKVNIIHCNSNNSLLLCAMIAENENRKKIGVIHGDVKIDQKKKGILGTKLYCILEKWLLNKTCSRCVAVSQSMKKILKERGVKENKIYVVYNGIQHIDYKKGPEYYAVPLRMCTVGNLIPVKNQITLLKAILILKNAYPEIKVTLDIYGDGWMKNEISTFIEYNNLDNVRLMGFSESVREKLNRYALYIHPSKYESFGISVVEAMQAGCCVIANDVGGLKEIIQKDYGYLTNCDNEENLVDNIAYCYMQRDEIKRKAIKGKHICEELFSDTTMVKRMIELYNEVS